MISKIAGNLAARPMEYYQRMPIGAEVQRNGGVHFRVWSTTAPNVRVRVSGDAEVNNSPLQAVLNPEGNHYFAGYVPEAKAGNFYKFVINGRLFPDPAARAQYGGPYLPSVVIDPDSYPGTTKNGRVFPQKAKSFARMIRPDAVVRRSPDCIEPVFVLKPLRSQLSAIEV
jgi:1,4-alpha-glucan branching enzyme